jgi:hypothetical protein
MPMQEWDRLGPRGGRVYQVSHSSPMTIAALTNVEFRDNPVGQDQATVEPVESFARRRSRCTHHAKSNRESWLSKNMASLGDTEYCRQYVIS